EAGDRAAQIEALEALAEVLIGANDSGGAAEIVARMEEIDAQHPKTVDLQKRLSERRPGGPRPAPAPARSAVPAISLTPVEAKVPDIQDGAFDLEEEPTIVTEASESEIASGGDALGDTEDEVASGPQS